MHHYHLAAQVAASGRKRPPVRENTATADSGMLRLAGGVWRTRAVGHRTPRPDGGCVPCHSRIFRTTDANDLMYQYDASRNYKPAADLGKIEVPLNLVNAQDDFRNLRRVGRGATRNSESEEREIHTAAGLRADARPLHLLRRSRLGEVSQGTAARFRALV